MFSDTASENYSLNCWVWFVGKENSLFFWEMRWLSDEDEEILILIWNAAMTLMEMFFIKTWLKLIYSTLRAFLEPFQT